MPLRNGALVPSFLGDLEQLQGFRQLIGTLSASILSSHIFSINKQMLCTYCTCWGYVMEDDKMVG